MMKKTLLLLTAVTAIAGGSASAQTLLAGYDFTNGTAIVAAPNAPTVYLSAFGTEAGTASIYLDGTHGSNAFVTATTGNEVTGFAGTTVNAGSGFSSSTASPTALALQGGATTGGVPAANGKVVVFTLSMTGYQSLVLSFASQRTATGFAGNTFSYSLDGTTFTPIAGLSITPAIAFATVTADLSTVTALNGAPSVYIGYTLAGASTATGNNRIDNIQFNATAVPEPATYAMVGFGLIGLVGVQRLRRRTA